MQLADDPVEGQAGAAAFGSRRSSVMNRCAAVTRVTWRCHPVQERPSKWSRPSPSSVRGSRVRCASGSCRSGPGRRGWSSRGGWTASTCLVVGPLGDQPPLGQEPVRSAHRAGYNARSPNEPGKTSPCMLIRATAPSPSGPTCADEASGTPFPSALTHRPTAADEAVGAAGHRPSTSSSTSGATSSSAASTGSSSAPQRRDPLRLAVRYEGIIHPAAINEWL